MSEARSHPVAEVLRARRAGPPGRDGHTVALVLEGGGMRGVVSAAMAAGLERLGLGRCFDLVVGSSAGAINGAALIAGASEQAAAAYCGPLASRSFVSIGKLLRGKPVIDVDSIRDLAGGLDAAGRQRVLEDSSRLHCIATEVETARPVDLSGMDSERALWDALLASSRMPWAGGDPIEIGGRRYLDGGIASAIPVAEAVAAGATHVLALQTRPHGVPRRSASRVGDRFIVRHLRRLNPQLAALYLARVAAYELVVEDIARRSRDGAGGPPYVLGVRPPAGAPCIGQLERRGPVLAAAATAAARLVYEALAPRSAALSAV